MILTDLSNAIKNLREKVLFHKHFNFDLLQLLYELIRNTQVFMVADQTECLAVKRDQFT